MSQSPALGSRAWQAAMDAYPEPSRRCCQGSCPTRVPLWVARLTGNRCLQHWEQGEVIDLRPLLAGRVP